MRASGGPHLGLQLFAGEMNFLRTLTTSPHLEVVPVWASFFFFNFLLWKFSNVFK